MEKRQYGDYYLGLDIGTESVGWAVTDMEYNIPRFNGKAMWGVRLFEEASTAADRRVFRVARRRLERRGQRLALLQELFETEIGKVDPGFFARLQEGALYPEDKSCKFNLFAGGAYTDKEYHKQYPTIYHLRDELMNSKQAHDVRLVYLAIHHILKYRGHFLFGGDLESVPSLADIMAEFTQEMADEEDGWKFECTDVQKMEEILQDETLSMQKKQKALEAVFASKDKRTKEWIKALSGGSVKLQNLFDGLPEEATEEIKSLSFKDEKYEQQTEALEKLLGEKYYYLEKLKAIYDWALLAKTLHGQDTLSAAKVAVYRQHKEDLALLKRVVRKYMPDQYRSVFSDPSPKEKNYCAYIGMTKKNGKKQPLETAKCTQEDFNKYVKKILDKIRAEDKDVETIRSRVEEGTFLPKATGKDNGVIPNQLHYQELERILQNAQGYLPFLQETDAQGITVADKIKQIMTFRIPYYVGPLNSSDPNGKNCWVTRRSREKIYPWNFENVVDVEQSATDFITRMTAQCTYLPGEKVLPKNSILYSRFTVLNTINSLKIKGEPITVEQKQNIYKELFEKRVKVTTKQIAKYFTSHGVPLEAEEISGVDAQIQASLGPEMKMRELMGENYEEDMAEEIIRLITIFGDDSTMLMARIKREFASRLTQEQIKRICKQKFSGWGRLSKALLTDICDVDEQTGEYRSVMTMLWETNCNLMQLLGEDFGFAKAIRRYAQEDGEETGLSYDLVRDMVLSPSVKRQAWQTLLIVKELEKIMGHAPKKIFVEVARGPEEKKRTESRKQQLMALYKKCKDETRNWLEELEGKDEGQFRQDKLFLYYTQKGRCMYTGEPIELDALFDQNRYDIDHIYPRSLIKDDSIDNRVLVKKEVNANKSDTYPLPAQVRSDRQAYWKHLLDGGFITKRKYDRLTRCTELSTDELSAFIARQLVETRQSTKAVAEILGRVFEDTPVVYSKAGLVSEFRQTMDLLKCREVNDLHHAKDAYLNIVVGNVYDTKFTRDPRNFFRERSNQDRYGYNLKRMYEFPVRRGDVTAWTPGEAGTIATVKRVMAKNNICFTRMAIERHGALFNVQPLKKGKGQLPLHGGDSPMNDITKYGGYNSLTGAYFMLVEHTEKKERVRSLIEMPLHLKAQMERSPERLTKMLREEKELVDPVVIIPRIKIFSLLEIDGFRMHITGRTNQYIICAPAHQLAVGYEWEKYIRSIVKFNAQAGAYEKIHKGETLTITKWDGITEEQNRKLYGVLTDKLQSTVYKVRLGGIGDKLAEKRETFERLSAEKQSVVLEQMLHLFACKNLAADLSEIGLGGHVGLVCTNRKISQYDSVKLIDQSVTGLFERARDLRV